MSDVPSKPCTAFQGPRRLANGPLADVALAVKAAMDADPAASILTFDDATGAVLDLDLRGSPADILARLGQRALPKTEANDDKAARPRGRPKLGVVAREVTLLPRHWDWLGQQSGGASQALRRLVDEARRMDGGRTQARTAQAAAYAFMTAMAGDLAHYEDATRALFAGDHDRFAAQTAAWPPDIRSYAERLMNGLGAPQHGDPTDAGLS